MEKIWTKYYPKGVAHEINPNEYKSIIDVFETSCLKFKEKECFKNMGVSMSYQELEEQSRNFAAYLQNKAGLKKGDRIAIQMPNLLQFPVALFGAIRAGLIVVNTNPLYTPREMKHQFNDSGVKAIVILANFAHQLETILKETEIKTVILTEIGDLFPFPKKQIINAVIKYIKKMVPPYSLDNAIGFNAVLEEGASLSLSTPTLNHEDIAFLQYTGGTTGVSKGAVLTHKNIISNMLQIREWMSPKLKEGEETIITALPLYHIFSLTVNCLAFMSYGGANLLITNPKDITGFIKELKKNHFTTFAGVNTLFVAMMNHPQFSQINFKNLKLSVAGGMALQKPVALKWAELTGAPIVEGFGLTETSPVLTCNPVDGTDRPGYIGIPVPSTDVRIIDEDKNVLSPGQTGELQGKGPQVMRGYWNKPEETKNVLTEDGWFSTGDIAEMGTDGFFKIVDRKKDMILVSGFNVYPNEIEEVLVSHPKVLEAAAVGVPDEHSTEAVKVFIVKKDDSLTPEEVKEFCKTNLTNYKVPKHIEFKKELPKTNVGKILRRALRDA